MAAEPRGRHKATRPQRWGRALSLTLLTALLPASAAVAFAWFYLRTHRADVLRLVVDPQGLTLVVLGLGVGWLLWLLLICVTYRRTRPLTAARPARIAGVIAVTLLCGVVTAPMAVSARYAVVQRSLLTTVFNGEQGATTPERTVRNPWGRRDRVNVLLLGGDGAVGRPGVRTDSVILASVDVRSGQGILFSLPRNLQEVPFPEGTPLAELYPEGFDRGIDDDATFFLNAV